MKLFESIYMLSIRYFILSSPQLWWSAEFWVEEQDPVAEAKRVL